MSEERFTIRGRDIEEMGKAEIIAEFKRFFLRVQEEQKQTQETIDVLLQVGR